MGERGLTEAEVIGVIRGMASGPLSGVRVPIGDDAALVSFARGDALLTVDSIYEGIHFNLDTHQLSDVGWKAVAAGVSDIAAMGGQACYALLSFGFDEPPAPEEVRGLTTGALEMLASCNCALVGGDVCRSRGGLAVTAAIAGTPPPGGPVLRSGARRGDAVCVTGDLGDSAAGLHILSRKDDALRAAFPRLVEAHLRPKPDVLAGELLASAGASAMEDVSDGLAADLRHICEESRVGAEVGEELIPMSAELVELARAEGVDPVEWAFAGGEDYGLLFTVAQRDLERAGEALRSHGIPYARLGTITGEGGPVLLGKDGASRDLARGGFDHFA